MKKTLALFLSIVIFLMCCFNVAASDTLNNYIVCNPAEVGALVTPRFSYINSIGVNILKKTLGFVSCGVTCTSIYDNYTFTVTCTLQRSNGNGWTDYKSATETFSGINTHVLSKSWYAPANYTYRTYATVVVKNSSGRVIETATGYSNSLYK